MRKVKNGSLSAVNKQEEATGAHGEAVASGRERLLEAALRQVREENNLASVTARSICAEAGITAPTLYHYFGDLGGLYCEVLERIFETRDYRHPSEQHDPQAVIDYVWDALLQAA